MCQQHLFIHPINKKYYSKNILDGDVTELNKNQHERELKKLIELFPQPRVTLNELTTKTPQKIFDIHYKQISLAPKGGRKKAAVNNDWMCTYSFIWPDKMKFESTAISKRQAAEKAATQALHWLYYNKRIDNKGCPIYDTVVLDELRSNLKESIQVTISDNAAERIERIWNDYENGIRDIYEATFRNAKHYSVQSPGMLTRDSSIDEDDFSDAETGSADDNMADTSELKVQLHPVYGKSISPPTSSTLARRERELREKFLEYDEALTPLPIDVYSDKITSTIENSRVTVIVGAAGCGKSTRAPAAVLRRWGAGTTAIVSEPRRVAAIGLAERVANELGEEVGKSIGYHVRLHAKPPKPPGGSVLYCTSGVLLRRLHANPGLEGCSHVFIDEAHERDVNTDVTLLLLRRAIHINPRLKVIIMSATLDTEVFTRYFESCPVVDVPGRTFPVDVFHLEDIKKKFSLQLHSTMENCKKEDAKPAVNCQEVAQVIKSIDKTQGEGAILVFLPGWAEIKLTKLILDEYYGQSSVHMILPVHSRLSTTEQTKMFSKPPPVRKVVLATNIAETSITIPDVVYVVDSGAHKENRIREGTGTASLETVWVSRAGAKQRSGRAGRVQPGHCYRLYTKEKEADFASHTTPEILRIPLEQTVLDCKTYAPDDKVEDFLSELPEPPSKKAIQFAVNDLVDLGALTSSEHLTRLGSLLSTLSLHPRLGTVVLHAAVAGCLLPAANVATHCADNVELFRNAADRREEIRDIKRKYNDTSDHAVLHYIQEEFERTASERGWSRVDEWCDKYGLRKDRLGYVKSLSNLHLEQLLKSGFVGPTSDDIIEELNQFSYVDELLVGVLLSGTNSLLTTRKLVRTKGKLKTDVGLFTSAGDRAHIGGESVNYGITKRSNKTQLLGFFGGYHSTERRALVVYKTSLLSPHTALLFSKGDLKKETIIEDVDSSILSLRRHKLRVHAPSSQADHILKAKEMLWATLQYYIDRDIKNIDYEEFRNVSKFKTRLFKVIGRVLVEANREYVQGKSREEDLEEFR
ncbi:LOW QUALITY PROTEIN: ATP-dependent RNA helicase DHX30 [Aphomia sociella]